MATEACGQILRPVFKHSRSRYCGNCVTGSQPPQPCESSHCKRVPRLTRGLFESSGRRRDSCRCWAHFHTCVCKPACKANQKWTRKGPMCAYCITSWGPPDRRREDLWGAPVSDKPEGDLALDSFVSLWSKDFACRITTVEEDDCPWCCCTGDVSFGGSGGAPFCFKKETHGVGWC